MPLEVRHICIHSKPIIQSKVVQPKVKLPIKVANEQQKHLKQTTLSFCKRTDDNIVKPACAQMPTTPIWDNEFSKILTSSEENNQSNLVPSISATVTNKVFIYHATIPSTLTFKGNVQTIYMYI